MMIQKRAYKTATLSLILLMSAPMIKPEDKAIEKTKDTIVKVVPNTSENSDKEKEAVKAEEKKEEKKPAKQRQAIHEHAEKDFFGRCWAYVVGKSVTTTPADVRTEAREELAAFPYVLNRFEELWKAQDENNYEAARDLSKELENLRRFFTSELGRNMMSSTVRDNNLLAEMNELEIKKMHGADSKAALERVNTVIGKLQNDLKSAFEEQAQSGKVDITAVNTLLAALTKEIGTIHAEDIVKPIVEQKTADSKLAGIRAALGLVIKKAIDPSKDLAQVGAPENNEKLAATLPADTKASKEAQEVKAEEAKKTEASETK